MKSELKHLPKEKQKELEKISKIISDSTPVEKIILFGSFARGDWVSDRYKEGHVTYEYKSDFDILVVVESEKLERDLDLWKNIEHEISSKVDTPVNLVIDTIHFINRKLKEGNYFYVDIKREGIYLFDRGEIDLIEPETLDSKSLKELAEKDYKFWYNKAQSFLKDYNHNIDDGEFNNAAFHLSQAAESFFAAILLVYTGYKPKSHNLEKIESLIVDMLPEFKDVFPKNSLKEKKLFELLKKAYIDARYKQGYKIKREELDYLYERSLELNKLVKKACEQRISGL